MSAEILRRAAALMRETAVAAEATGVWRGDGSDATTADDGAFTHHVAMFANPAVALAVADLLDELLRSLSVFGEPSDDDPLWMKSTASSALTVARAYLGEPA